MKLAFDIPGLKTHSPLNGNRLHWGAITRRKEAERTAVVWHWPFGQMVAGLKSGQKAIVTLTRTGPRRLDDDNLAASFKTVRDSVAKRLGVDDGDSERVGWLYRQGKGEYCVRIEIEVVAP